MPEIVLHLLTPHHTNNHRARVLHLDALLFYVLAFAVFHVGIQWLHRSHPDILGFATDIHLEQLLAATNSKRQEAELSPLRYSEQLSIGAAEKAKDMFAKNYWAHLSPDGKSPWEFITSAGYRYSIAGENLAKNFSTSGAVVDAWMASPTHRDNILKPAYRDIGFAVVNGVLNGEETTLVVQMFGATGKDLAQQPFGPIPAGSTQVPQVVVTEVASATQTLAAPAPIVAFASVISRPLMDVSGLTRSVTLLFIGVLLGVFAMDAWLVMRRRIVRTSGHTLGHLVFLGSLFFVMGAMTRGSIL